MINLLELNYKEIININVKLEIPQNLYEKMDIISMDKVSVIGNIQKDIEYNYLVNLDVAGKMMLHDSITYDEIPYNFNVKIEETLENSLKTLDLIDFLWHYIVLEVPIRITNSEVSEMQNEHYAVISEEEYNRRNNPFKDFFNE